MLLVRDMGVLHEQLSAHPQMGHEGYLGQWTVNGLRAVHGERHPEKFAASDNVQNRGVFEVADEVFGAKVMAAD
ncbi:hypothetical protein StoSoilB5_31430 [Arthrobacter sp. StoSoilB5]|nr:hypothetical protein StoSoilB5_31430 [Arthrobacter sp. StoSoilB5]